MRKKICFCTTLGGTLGFVKELSLYLVEKENYEVTWIAGDDERLHKFVSEHEHFNFIPMNMKRGLGLTLCNILPEMLAHGQLLLHGWLELRLAYIANGE